MKHSVFTKILCLVLCTAVCFSIPFCLTATALNVQAGETNVKPVDCDLVAMTFNVLISSTASDTMLATEDRMELVVDTINRYKPDIVGFQEANSSWVSYLESRNTGIAYDGINFGSWWIDDAQEYDLIKFESANTTGASLPIAFKRAAFTLLEEGEQAYDYSAIGVTSRQPRYFQWAKLKHNASGKTLLLTNTHLSVNGDNEANNTDAGNMLLRDTEAAQLKAFWDANITDDTIFLGFGDYNTTFTREAAGDFGAQVNALENLSGGLVQPAAKIALFADKNSSSYNTYIDNIFVNPNVTDVVEHYRVTDSYNGKYASDHRAMIAYVNFNNCEGFASGRYDAKSRTLTDTVTETTYTITPTVPDGFTYTIKDAAGTALASNTVSLNPGENNYTVTVSSSNGNAPDTVIQATITCNDSSLDPTISASEALAAYYGGGEVHVALPQGTTSTALSFTGGATYALYSDADCTVAQSTTITGFTATRATYYLKITDGNYTAIVPVKLYHPTYGELPAKTLYCDDNWAALSNGTAVVWDDGTDVYIASVGTTAFGTITKMTNYVNTKKYSGYTGYVAAGTYYEQATLNYPFTLLGANHDIDPLERSADKWTRNAARRPESVIHGYLKPTATATPITIKGFHFATEQPVDYAAIQANAGGTGTITIQIENNIFDHEFLNDPTYNSPIQSIGTAQKTGYIKNNIFAGSYKGRGMTMRNLNGLVISGNYFYNWATTMFLSSEISAGNNNPGHLSFTLSGNRFENCYGDSELSTAYAVEGAEINILDNQFISNHCVAIKIPLNTETDITDGQTVDFSKISLNIADNTFKNNQYGIRVSTNSAEISKASVKINRNSVNGCVGYALSAVCSDTSVEDAATFTVDATYNYLDDATDPASHISVGTNTTVNYTPYYTDAALTTLNDGTLKTLTGVTVENFSGTYDGQAHTVSISGTQEGDLVTYSTDSYNYSTTPVTLTDVGSETVYVKVSRTGYFDFITSATIEISNADLTGITLKDYNGIYDGNAHGITVENMPNDAHIYYSTDNETFVETAPTFTDAGEYTVYVMIGKANYNVYNGSATVTITGLPMGGFTALPYLGKVDGQSHNVTVLGLQEGDTVTYSTDGITFTADPAITNKGVYDVQVKIERKNYEPVILYSRVTLIDADDGKIVSLIAQSPELMKDGTGFSALWTMLIDPSSDFNFGGEDIHFTSYGMIYSNSEDKLTQYALQGALGDTPEETSSIKRYIYAQPENGQTELKKVYKTYRHQITGVPEGKDRYGMAFIRFTYNEREYELYSPCVDGSVLLGGTVSGTGAPSVSPDPFDD